jgi:hypothetical protein
MRLTWTALSAMLCFCLLMPARSTAQATEEQGLQSSIGFRAGYGVTVGNWSYSRVAPAVRQFGGGLTYGGDLTLRLNPKLALVLAGAHTIPDCSRWEQYASTNGDHVSATASFTDLSFSFRPLLFSTSTDQVGVELGAIGLFASGEETINGERYDYDFFSSFRMGFQGAFQYDRLVSESVALTMRAGVIVAPEAMQYADGETRTIIFLPVSVGIRFLF